MLSEVVNQATENSKAEFLEARNKKIGDLSFITTHFCLKS